MHPLASAQAPADLATRAHPLPTLEAIQRLQAAMVPLATELPEPEHIFHDGWYERRLLVPAGMLIVGKIHRHPSPFGVIRGDAWVISQHGRTRVSAGHWGVSPAGVKRVALALTDTLFVNLHANPTNTRDLAAIEAANIVPEPLLLPVTQMREVH